MRAMGLEDGRRSSSDSDDSEVSSSDSSSCVTACGLGGGRAMESSGMFDRPRG